MSSPHRPRKKKPGVTIMSSTKSLKANTDGTRMSRVRAQTPEFPLAACLWPTRRSTSQWVVLPLILMAVGLFRWAVGFWGFSGFQTPPMHGDFEAQRHWMELTTNLPISQWYFYDLEYWGLDYPPLTAYHSWLLGKIGSMINPAWFALNSSRGLEDASLKLFMRASVLVSEYLIYIPAAIVLCRRQARFSGVNVSEASAALVAILMQPATILIDHAHFQYNTVMLGFVLASMSSMYAGRRLWGCIYFVAAICFKQMALYYAPAIFAYLVGVCVTPRLNLSRFIAIALVTLTSFAIMFAPLLLGSLYQAFRDPSSIKTLIPPALFTRLPLAIDHLSLAYPVALQLSQVIHRIFPFARGLFEDKVANFWCTINTIHKLGSYPEELLSQLSLCMTFVAILPSCMVILSSPRKQILPLALASCAWGFFLFSFQVHEKSVLLPLLPMTVLLGMEGGLKPATRAWVGWANMLGVWTLYPLLKRDELRVPYVVLALLWAYLLGLPPTSFTLYHPMREGLSGATKLLHLSFYAAMLVWHGLEVIVPPPNGKPDLWVVINCVLGAAGFAICWLWCTWQVILGSGIMEDYFGVRIRLEREAAAQRDGQAKSASKKSR